MTIKTELKNLLSKGKLTGREAGQLILLDNWLADHGKETFLSKKDISSIKASLKTSEDINEYNNYVELYRIVDYTLKEAHIIALEIQKYLQISIHEFDKYLTEDSIRTIQMFRLPAIVTQKQYDELRAKQKAIKLKEIHNLEEVLENRAIRITPEEIKDKHIEGDEEGNFYPYLSHYLQEDYPDLWKETVSSLLEDIKQNNIQFIQMTGKDTDKLQAVWNSMDGWREINLGRLAGEINEEMKDPDSKKFESLAKKEKALIQKLYQANKNNKVDQDSLIKSLEQLLSGSMTEEEERKLLDFTFTSTEDLYNAGFSEWVEDIDTYYSNWDEESSARPKGMMQSDKVAIIQDPDPEELDERGYYKDDDPLSEISGLKRYQNPNSHKFDKPISDKYDLSMTDILRLNHKYISEKIKAFLAAQAVIETLSGVVGVNFKEDMDNWYSDIEDYLELYNYMMSPQKRYTSPPYYLGLPKLEVFKIGKLKPTAKSIRYYTDRMAIALGAGWHKNIRENGFTFVDLMKPLEFEDLEEGSLAKEMLDDLSDYMENHNDQS